DLIMSSGGGSRDLPVTGDAAIGNGTGIHATGSPRGLLTESSGQNATRNDSFTGVMVDPSQPMQDFESLRPTPHASAPITERFGSIFRTMGVAGASGGVAAGRSHTFTSRSRNTVKTVSFAVPQLTMNETCIPSSVDVASTTGGSTLIGELETDGSSSIRVLKNGTREVSNDDDLPLAATLLASSVVETPPPTLSQSVEDILKRIRRYMAACNKLGVKPNIREFEIIGLSKVPEFDVVKFLDYILQAGRNAESIDQHAIDRAMQAGHLNLKRSEQNEVLSAMAGPPLTQDKVLTELKGCLLDIGSVPIFLKAIYPFTSEPNVKTEQADAVMKQFIGKANAVTRTSTFNIADFLSRMRKEVPTLELFQVLSTVQRCNTTPYTKQSFRTDLEASGVRNIPENAFKEGIASLCGSNTDIPPVLALFGRTVKLLGARHFDRYCLSYLMPVSGMRRIKSGVPNPFTLGSLSRPSSNASLPAESAYTAVDSLSPTQRSSARHSPSNSPRNSRASRLFNFFTMKPREISGDVAIVAKDVTPISNSSEPNTLEKNMNRVSSSNATSSLQMAQTVLPVDSIIVDEPHTSKRHSSSLNSVRPLNPGIMSEELDFANATILTSESEQPPVNAGILLSVEKPVDKSVLMTRFDYVEPDHNQQPHRQIPCNKDHHVLGEPELSGTVNKRLIKVVRVTKSLAVVLDEGEKGVRETNLLTNQEEGNMTQTEQPDDETFVTEVPPYESEDVKTNVSGLGRMKKGIKAVKIKHVVTPVEYIEESGSLLTARPVKEKLNAIPTEKDAEVFVESKLDVPNLQLEIPVTIENVSVKTAVEPIGPITSKEPYAVLEVLTAGKQDATTSSDSETKSLSAKEFAETRDKLLRAAPSGWLCRMIKKLDELAPAFDFSKFSTRLADIPSFVAIDEIRIRQELAKCGALLSDDDFRDLCSHINSENPKEAYSAFEAISDASNRVGPDVFVTEMIPQVLQQSTREIEWIKRIRHSAPGDWWPRFVRKIGQYRPDFNLPLFMAKIGAIPLPMVSDETVMKALADSGTALTASQFYHVKEAIVPGKPLVATGAFRTMSDAVHTLGAQSAIDGVLPGLGMWVADTKTVFGSIHTLNTDGSDEWLSKFLRKTAEFSLEFDVTRFAAEMSKFQGDVAEEKLLRSLNDCGAGFTMDDLTAVLAFMNPEHPEDAVMKLRSLGNAYKHAGDSAIFTYEVLPASLYPTSAEMNILQKLQRCAPPGWWPKFVSSVRSHYLMFDLSHFVVELSSCILPQSLDSASISRLLAKSKAPLSKMELRAIEDQMAPGQHFIVVSAYRTLASAIQEVGIASFVGIISPILSFVDRSRQTSHAVLKVIKGDVEEDETESQQGDEDALFSDSELSDARERLSQIGQPGWLYRMIKKLALIAPSFDLAKFINLLAEVPSFVTIDASFVRDELLICGAALSDPEFETLLLSIDASNPQNAIAVFEAIAEVGSSIGSDAFMSKLIPGLVKPENEELYWIKKIKRSAPGDWWPRFLRKIGQHKPDFNLPLFVAKLGAIQLPMVSDETVMKAFADAGAALTIAQLTQVKEAIVPGKPLVATGAFRTMSDAVHTLGIHAMLGAVLPSLGLWVADKRPEVTMAAALGSAFTEGWLSCLLKATCQNSPDFDVTVLARELSTLFEDPVPTNSHILNAFELAGASISEDELVQIEVSISPENPADAVIAFRALGLSFKECKSAKMFSQDILPLTLRRTLTFQEMDALARIEKCTPSGWWPKFLGAIKAYFPGFQLHSFLEGLREYPIQDLDDSALLQLFRRSSAPLTPNQFTSVKQVLALGNHERIGAMFTSLHDAVNLVGMASMVGVLSPILSKPARKRHRILRLVSTKAPNPKELVTASQTHRKSIPRPQSPIRSPSQTATREEPTGTRSISPNPRKSSITHEMGRSASPRGSNTGNKYVSPRTPVVGSGSSSPRNSLSGRGRSQRNSVGHGSPRKGSSASSSGANINDVRSTIATVSTSASYTSVVASKPPFILPKPDESEVKPVSENVSKRPSHVSLSGKSIKSVDSAGYRKGFVESLHDSASMDSTGMPRVLSPEDCIVAIKLLKLFPRRNLIWSRFATLLDTLYPDFNGYEFICKVNDTEDQISDTSIKSFLKASGAPLSDTEFDRIKLESGISAEFLTLLQPWIRSAAPRRFYFKILSIWVKAEDLEKTSFEDGLAQIISGCPSFHPNLFGFLTGCEHRHPSFSMLKFLDAFSSFQTLTTTEMIVSCFKYAGVLNVSFDDCRTLLFTLFGFWDLEDLSKVSKTIRSVGVKNFLQNLAHSLKATEAQARHSAMAWISSIAELGPNAHFQLEPFENACKQFYSDFNLPILFLRLATSDRITSERDFQHTLASIGMQVSLHQYNQIIAFLCGNLEHHLVILQRWQEFLIIFGYEHFSRIIVDVQKEQRLMSSFIMVRVIFSQQSLGTHHFWQSFLTRVDSLSINAQFNLRSFIASCTAHTSDFTLQKFCDALRAVPRLDLNSVQCCFKACGIHFGVRSVEYGEIMTSLFGDHSVSFEGMQEWHYILKKLGPDWSVMYMAALADQRQKVEQSVAALRSEIETIPVLLDNRMQQIKLTFSPFIENCRRMSSDSSFSMKELLNKLSRLPERVEVAETLIGTFAACRILVSRQKYEWLIGSVAGNDFLSGVTVFKMLITFLKKWGMDWNMWIVWSLIDDKGANEGALMDFLLHVREIGPGMTIDCPSFLEQCEALGAPSNFSLETFTDSLLCGVGPITLDSVEAAFRSCGINSESSQYIDAIAALTGSNILDSSLQVLTYWVAFIRVWGIQWFSRTSVTFFDRLKVAQMAKRRFDASLSIENRINLRTFLWYCQIKNGGFSLNDFFSVLVPTGDGLSSENLIMILSSQGIDITEGELQNLLGVLTGATGEGGMRVMREWIGLMRTCTIPFYLLIWRLETVWDSVNVDQGLAVSAFRSRVKFACPKFSVEKFISASRAIQADWDVERFLDLMVNVRGEISTSSFQQAFRDMGVVLSYEETIELLFALTGEFSFSTAADWIYTARLVGTHTLLEAEGCLKTKEDWFSRVVRVVTTGAEKVVEDIF
ncbi:hypothetical protein BC830DRAFT_1108302, partial [Chytriomyces sp. MP71]